MNPLDEIGLLDAPWINKKEKPKTWGRIVLESVAAKPVAFNPMLAKISGSATAGLFMSQLLYWWGKGQKENWIYKTISEIHSETFLTRSEQDNAIRRWVELGVLEKRIIGIPPKRHFCISVEKLILLLKASNQPVKNGKSN